METAMVKEQFEQQTFRTVKEIDDVSLLARKGLMQHLWTAYKRNYCGGGADFMKSVTEVAPSSLSVKLAILTSIN